VTALFERQMASMLDRMTDRGMRTDGQRMSAADIAGMFQMARWVREFRQAIKPDMASTMNTGAADLAASVLPGLDFDPTDPAAVNFLRATSQRFAEQVNDTTWRALQASLIEGIKAGEPMPKLKATARATHYVKRWLERENTAGKLVTLTLRRRKRFKPLFFSGGSSRVRATCLGRGTVVCLLLYRTLREQPVEPLELCGATLFRGAVRLRDAGAFGKDGRLFLCGLRQSLKVCRELCRTSTVSQGIYQFLKLAGNLLLGTTSRLARALELVKDAGEFVGFSSQPDERTLDRIEPEARSVGGNPHRQ
jgi:hypothetical protein